MEKNKLTKSKDAKLLGVCGGIAEWMGVDPTVIRIATLVVSLFSGIGIVAYIIGALLMPKE